MGCVTEQTVWAVSQSGQLGLSHRADNWGCLTERTVWAVSQSGQHGLSHRADNWGCLTERHRKLDSTAAFVGTAQTARQYRRLHGNSADSIAVSMGTAQSQTVSPSPWEQRRRPDSIAVSMGTAQSQTVSPSPWEQHRVSSTESQSVSNYSEKAKHVSFFFLAKTQDKTAPTDHYCHQGYFHHCVTSICCLLRRLGTRGVCWWGGGGGSGLNLCWCYC